MATLTVAPALPPAAPPSDPPLPDRPSLLAALFLLIRELLPQCNELPSTVSEILEKTGAGKSQAYEMRDRLRQVLPTLIGTPGRPPAAAAAGTARPAIVEAVRDYLMRHPGAACGPGNRFRYTDSFRRLIVSFAAPGQPGHEMSVSDLASAAGVPTGTLNDWLYPQSGAQLASSPADSLPEVDDAPGVLSCIRNTHLRLIVSLWRSWTGPFLAFCNLLRTEYRLPYGATFIGNFLQCMGLRQRRRQIPVEAPWSSGTFRTLFPGAQWLGDGTSIAIHWGAQIFVFNVEALHDPASDSMVGFKVSDTENEEALRRAYQAGLETTGAAPLAVTLDNKPCNHSPGAVAALPGTILLRSTPNRGQSKAAIEGAFGLFQQALPWLEIRGATPRERARCALRLILTAWYRGRNGKPRKRLRGRTPADVYMNTRPTHEEIKAALDWFQELQRRQERARLTQEGRRDPVRLALLRQGLAELHIPDPDGRLSISLACYARDAIARGLAVFQAKQELGSLPTDADPGRYLGGIIRQLHTKLELERIAVHLLEQRIRLRDLTLESLGRTAHRLRAQLPLDALPEAYVDRALDAAVTVDFRFWGQAAANALTVFAETQRQQTYHALCKRIGVGFKADRERRQDLIDWLAKVTAAPP